MKASFGFCGGASLALKSEGQAFACARFLSAVYPKPWAKEYSPASCIGTAAQHIAADSRFVRKKGACLLGAGESGLFFDI
jgi:hypothetical protein